MTKRHPQETLDSYKRTFNQAVLQITERSAAGPGTTSKVTVTALGTLVVSQLLEKYLGLSLLP